MEISLSHSIAMGHRIPNHEGGAGKCARLHGHTYRFDVTLKAPLLRDGFVIDFGVVKNALNEWDHRTILWDRDELVFGRGNLLIELESKKIEMESAVGIIRVPFIPTAEAIAMFWSDCLFQELRKFHGVETVTYEEQEEYAVMVDVWESLTTSARYVRR